MTISNKKSMNNNSNESVKNTKKPELDAVIKDVKIQIRKHYAGYKEQIERIGNVLKDTKIIKEHDICTEIKNALREEIKEKIISSDTIERCCSDEWKRKTKNKDPQLRIFEAKNSQEQRTGTNLNTNVTSERQILQQKFKSDDDYDSSKIEGHKPEEELATGSSKEATELSSQSGEVTPAWDETESYTNSASGFSVGGGGPADLKSDKTHAGDSSVEISGEQNKKDVSTFEFLVSRENLWDNLIMPLAHLKSKKDMVWIRVTLNSSTRIAILRAEETHSEGIQ